jgi:serine/threonine-protein kinase
MPQRFLQEARTAASLDDHPNVVKVYSAKERQGLRLFVMKYIDGCTLEQLLRATGPLPVGLAGHVLGQVALALHYAHERGVVHRDVKPANVMIDRQGTAIVTDFGIARVAQGEHLTRTGFAIGTPAYMSPEQWRVEELTAASDQYGLGAIAYQLLTGELPFGGSAYEVQEGHLHGTARPLRDARPDCPPALEAIVERMLAKEPAARWPDLLAVHEALAEMPRAPGAQLAAELSALIPQALPSVASGGQTPRSPIPLHRDPMAASPEAVPEAPSRPAEPPAEPPAATDPGILREGAPNDPAATSSLAETGYQAPDAVRISSLEGVQITDRESEPLGGEIARTLVWRRSRPTLVAAGAVALTAIAVALFTVRGRLGGGDSTPALPVTPTPAPPTTVSPPPSVDTAAPPSDSAITATAAGVDTSAAPPDSAARDSIASGIPARVRIRREFLRRSLAVGDSVRLSARVLDAAERRVDTAQVQWSSSAPRRVAIRSSAAGRYAVALADGPRVHVVARSGALADTARFEVVPAPPRGIAAPETPGRAPPTPPTPNRPAAAAPPSEAEARAVVDPVARSIAERRADDLAQLAPADGDGTSARDFLAWLSRQRVLKVASTERGVPVVTGAGRATLDFKVWIDPAGLGRKRSANFRATLVHDGGAWRVERLQLRDRFGGT